MNIEVDYNPSPKEMFFISVGLSDTIAISFDYTTKGHRVIKQVLRENKPEPETGIEKADGNWEAILLKDGRLVKKYAVNWSDKGKIDEVNGEVWETVWEKPIQKISADLLLGYSQYISDNYENLDQAKMRQFEEDIRSLIREYEEPDTNTLLRYQA